MTRINVIPVGCLSDKHLLAEYRELPRVFTAVNKIYESEGVLSVPENSPNYCLGAGHVKFFYNKLIWLYRRYGQLAGELRRRGVNLNEELFESIDSFGFGLSIRIGQRDWEPSPEDMYLNMARLVNRSTRMPLVEEEIRSIILSRI